MNSPHISGVNLVLEKPTATAELNQSVGLTGAEADERLRQFGPNAVVEKQVHPLARIMRHFWAPVPWMLEATIALQLALGQWLTAGLIAALLVLNVILGAVQESRAQAALALLKQRLSLKTRVKRDGAWIDTVAAVLVPDDIVQISLGDVVPADVTLVRRLVIGGSVDADRRIGSGRNRGRTDHLCRRPGSARRGDRQGRRHRDPDLFRPHRRTGQHRACRERRAEGGAGGRA